MVEVTCGDCEKKYDANTSNRDIHVCEEIRTCPKCGAAWDDYVLKHINEDGDIEMRCTFIGCSFREPISKEAPKSQ